MFLRPYSFQHKEKFSVSHYEIQKQHCGIQIRTVKQRICKSVQKNMMGQTELINRTETIITYSDLHEKSYCNITTRAATYPITALVVDIIVFWQIFTKE